MPHVRLMYVSFLLSVFMNAAIPIAAVLTVSVGPSVAANSMLCLLIVLSSYSK